ncbi:hypothetical protein [Mycolicibacterium sp. A43C]
MTAMTAAPHGEMRRPAATLVYDSAKYSRITGSDMPRRTMTVTELWVHPKGDRQQRTNLSELPDGDLLHLFRTFAKDITATQLKNQSNESYAEVVDLEPIGRSLTLAVEVGRYGEKGRLIDTNTMEEKAKFGPTDAIQVTTHGVLTLPKNATSALLFLERANNQCGVVRLLHLFGERFALAYPDLKLETDAVVESEAWLDHANLVRVSAYRRHKTHDISDNHAAAQEPKYAGELTHSLVPGPGMEALARSIFDNLRNGTLSVGELLSFDEDDEDAQAEVTLEGNGKRKTFIIGRERRPSVSYPLSDHNEEAWTSKQIRNFVFQQEYAHDLYDRIGIDWTHANTVGTWTEEQLGAKMVMRGGEQS